MRLVRVQSAICNAQICNAQAVSGEGLQADAEQASTRLLVPLVCPLFAVEQPLDLIRTQRLPIEQEGMHAGDLPLPALPGLSVVFLHVIAWHGCSLASRAGCAYVGRGGDVRREPAHTGGGHGRAIAGVEYARGAAAHGGDADGDIRPQIEQGGTVNEDPLRTKLCEEYGCEVPIVAFAHTKDVIAAVTNAGGIGVLGGIGMSPDGLRADIRWIKERVGDRPFGVDLIVPASFVEGNREDLDTMIPQEHRDFVDKLHREHDIPIPKQAGAGQGNPIGDPRLLERSRESLEVLFEEHVPIFASGLGSPAFIVDRAHEEGMKVWGLIGLPRQAARQVEAGVDVVIAQGYDAGGHSGSIGTFTLVPEVVRIAEGTDTLVLAAGGVSGGKHLAAAVAMGAAGVWTGTIWLATHESNTGMFQKQRLVEARAEDAIQSRAWTGKPVRQLRSKYSDAWKQPDAPEPLQMPLQGMLVGPLIAGIGEARMEDWMIQPAGQSVVGIRELKPAAEVVFDMAEEAQERLEFLAADLVSG